MNSKLVVVIVVIATLIILAFGWFYLKDVMVDFDVDPDTSKPSQITDNVSELI